MPTKEQNAVFKKYGVRRGELYRRMADRGMTLSGAMHEAFRDPVTAEVRQEMHELVDAQASDSLIWHQYRICDDGPYRHFYEQKAERDEVVQQA